MRRISFARHRPFYAAILAGVASGAAGLSIGPLPAVVTAANGFFIVYLAMMAATLPRLTPDYLRAHAARDDEPVWVIFLVTLAAVCAAIAALFLTINARQAPHGLAFTLALSAVPLGWFTIHMMAALHYAHVFWQRGGDDAAGESPRGGLDFPKTEAPDGYDFVYFAYVIGMTAQTSDVGVTTGRMRRMALAHSVVSFFFNTVLVAAAVNLAVALGSS